MEHDDAEALPAGLDPEGLLVPDGFHVRGFADGVSIPALVVSLHVGAIEEDEEGGGYSVYVQPWSLPAGDYEGPLKADTLQEALDLMIVRFALPDR